MSYILLQNIFPGSEHHGGNARTAQVRAFLSGIADVREVPVAPVRGARSFRRSAIIGAGALRHARPFRTSLGTRAAFAMGARVAAQVPALNAAISKWGTPALFATESLWMAAGILPSLRKRACPIVGIHQNIDAFNWTLGRDEKLGLAFHELATFQHCDLVLSLSLEDAWLLRNLGVKSHFFPYIPVPEKLDELQRIGRGRRGGSRETDLVLGTATNDITREGIQELLEFLSTRRVPLARPLAIVGTGTEVFREKYASDKIHILGGVTNEQLERLVTNANALVVNQSRGSGALIRIADWGLAGLPIIASRHAARSAPPLPNIFTCETLAAMVDLLIGAPLPCGGPQGAPKPWLAAVASAREEMLAVVSATRGVTTC